MYVRGEGGSVIGMDRPLPEGIADRIASGLLVRVNADGSPLGSARPSAPSPAPAGGSALTAGVSPRPPRTATRPAWTTWAQAVHGLTEQQAKDMTKAQLMDLPDQPAAQEPAEEADEQEAETPPAPAADGRPDADAPKSEWIDYAFRLGKGTREELGVFTREDLIELTA